MEKKTHISTIEWMLVIGALATVDVIQALLDLAYQAGVIANRFIDVFVGMSFALYLQLRGQSLSDTKRLTALLVTFLGEEIPDVDVLPLWSLDGIYSWRLDRAQEKAEKEAEIAALEADVESIERVERDISRDNE